MPSRAMDDDDDRHVSLGVRPSARVKTVATMLALCEFACSQGAHKPAWRETAPNVQSGAVTASLAHFGLTSLVIKQAKDNIWVGGSDSGGFD